MKKAFRLGYQAFFEGALTSPFRGMLKKEWERGFNAAFKDNLRGRYVQNLQSQDFR
jgi:hypothetical protein